MSPKHARPEDLPDPAEEQIDPTDSSVSTEPTDPTGSSERVAQTPGHALEETSPDEDPPPPPPAARRARRGRGGRGPHVRSRWMWTLLAVIGVALVAWLVVSVARPDEVATPTPSASASESPEQRTLLIQVRNDSDLGANNLVAGIGADLPATQVLVPSRLIVDVPGAGQQTLGQSARLIDRSASQDALSDLLALRVDGTLALSRLALAGMVDFVGGITVTVDRPITQTDEATGAETVVVPAGQQTLNGTQAAAYALAWLPDEPEASRLARYSAVMSETIEALPDDQVRIEQMLTSLGSSASTTTSTADVARFLLDLRSGITAGSQQVRVLPTTDIESGSDLAVVRADLPAAEELLASVLPTAQLDDEQARPRVLVQNGIGTPGLGADARDKLVGAGMVFINGGNAESFGHEQTQVIIPDTSTQARTLGTEVAEALGVPQSAVVVADEGQNVADVVVVLGADFQP